MHILIYIIIIAAVYVVSFKDDFTKENLEKVAPFLVLIGVIILLFALLGSI